LQAAAKITGNGDEVREEYRTKKTEFDEKRKDMKLLENQIVFLQDVINERVQLYESQRQSKAREISNYFTVRFLK